ncbi:MAG: acetoacetyl-CoA reductase [Alphaproteobacteria bacterium]|nr:acetoacetyl-CoA reductase [Alphaproteobacteria bacterium]NDC55721.1 acetoacetyl-CoA reductase [Alphaproteobacteria bacterium]NDG04657.1 acetoacetyl-CoA reductase [Alphaproteobacteria bacterium]
MSKVVLVTGGTRGIGAAIAEAFQKGGYKVAATYHGNDDVAKSFTARTGIPAFKFDVADFAACQKGVEAVVTQLGAIDVLVNNAGITRDTFLHKMTPVQWMDVIHTNLNSVFNMSRLVIENMRNRGFGRIITISSINGQAGQIGQTNYAAAKAGVIGFSKALALENAGKGITVNVVAPGYIDTDMVRAISDNVLEAIVARIPVKRLGRTDEIAAAVLYLASDEAAYMTGATLNVNGGLFMG